MKGPLPSAEVRIHTVHLSEARPESLTPAESARAARFRFESDRTRWTRAHSALREILATYTKCPPLELAFLENEHGKPTLGDFPAIHFNLTHSGDYALIAVSRIAPVGVDIERIRPNVNVAALLERLGETNLPAGEFELWQRWTTREASTKAAGSPLFQKPHARIRVQSIDAPAGYAASIAMDFSALANPEDVSSNRDMIVEIRSSL